MNWGFDGTVANRWLGSLYVPFAGTFVYYRENLEQAGRIYGYAWEENQMKLSSSDSLGTFMPQRNT